MDIKKTLEKVKTVRSKMKRKLPEPRCSAVIVAAGSSQRMGSDKILAPLDGKPVLVRTLSAFQNSALVDEIVIVTRSESIEKIADLCKENGFDKVSKVILGGNTRTESALAGVSEVKPEASLIAIHDGARPLLSLELIERTVYAAREFYAAVPAIKCTDTMKLVDGKGIITGTADRESLVRIQTPQVFSAEIIKGALTHAVTKELALTDDCSAVELMGVKTHVVEGEESNIKLTTPWDMILAEAILKEQGE